MLPVLFFALVGGLGAVFSLQGCSTKKGSGGDSKNPATLGKDPALSFTSQDNSLAFNLYQKIVSGGVSPQTIDQGYRIANYSRIHCPDKSQTSCSVGVRDGKVEPEEVFEYCLDQESTCRPHIEAELKRALPWGLDDSKVQKKVQENIDFLQQLLEKKGIKKDSVEFQTRMAVGLCALVSIFDQKTVNANLRLFIPLYKQLIELDLLEYREYIFKNGGLGLVDRDSEERSALDALKTSKGKCTEISTILYSVLKMAGLKPFFVLVNPSKSKEVILQEYSQTDPFSFHVSVGLKIDKKVQILDAAIMNANAAHEEYYPMTNRQFLALHYVNLGLLDSLKVFHGDKKSSDFQQFFQSALQLDSKQPITYFNLANPFNNQGAKDKIVSHYQTIIRLYPGLYGAYVGLADFYKTSGDYDAALNILNQANKIHPDVAFLNYKIGEVLISKGNFEDRALLLQALPYFEKAVQLYPKDLNFLLNLAANQSKLNQYELALKTYNTAIGLPKSNPNLFRTFNQSFIKSGDDPQDIILSKIYLGRGLMYSALDQQEQAIQDFDKSNTFVKNTSPLYLDNLYFRGVSYGKKGDKEKSKSDFVDFLKIVKKTDNESVQKIFSAYGEIHRAAFKKGKWPEQIKIIEKDTGLDVLRINALFSTAEILVELGEVQEGLKFVETIVQGIAQTKKEIFQKKKPVSPITRKFLNQIFYQIPASLQKDPSIRQLWK